MKSENRVSLSTKGISPICQKSPESDACRYVFCEHNSTGDLLQLQKLLKNAEEHISLLEKELQDSQGHISKLELELDHTIASLTREIATRQEMEKHAGTDILTGIMNRRALLQGCIKMLHEELRKEDIDKQYISMLFIDADHFKNVNDTYGHGMGDCVLKKLAEKLDEIKRYGDIVGRYGGEEFLCIIPHKHIDDIKIIANRILEEIRNMEVFGTENECLVTPLKITVSIGVYTFQLDTLQGTKDVPPTNITTLLEQITENSIKNADVALYMAKKTGRNRACYQK